MLPLFTELIMPLALNYTILRGLWILAAILFYEIKYHFCKDLYLAFFWHSFTELCHDLLHYNGDF
jgi:hypothetical protein